MRHTGYLLLSSRRDEALPACLARGAAHLAGRISRSRLGRGRPVERLPPCGLAPDGIMDCGDLEAFPVGACGYLLFVSTFTDSQAALALAIAAKVPVLLTGLPGQGKTATITGIADRYGLLLRTLIASQREPADLNGMPYADLNSGSVHMLPQQWAKDLVAASGRTQSGTASVLFFDEISTAPPALQAACLRILGERMVGDLQLPDDVAIVLAQNPPEFAADGWDLAAPLSNRVVHLDWALPPEFVADGFVHGFAPVEVPNIDPIALEPAIQRAKSLVGSFLKFRPELLATVPKTDADRSKPFASPRSWEFVARLLGVADAAGASTGPRDLLIVGAVGHGPGYEFATWLDNLDLPDPEAILASPERFAVPDRKDKVYAALISVLAAYRANPTTQRWIAFGQVLRTVAEAGSKDLAYVAASAWAADTERSKAAMSTLEPQVLAAFIPLLAELRAISRKQGSGAHS